MAQWGSSPGTGQNADKIGPLSSTVQLAQTGVGAFRNSDDLGKVAGNPSTSLGLPRRAQAGLDLLPHSQGVPVAEVVLSQKGEAELVAAAGVGEEEDQSLLVAVQASSSAGVIACSELSNPNQHNALK